MRTLAVFFVFGRGDSAKLTQARKEKTPRLHRTQTWGTREQAAVAVAVGHFLTIGYK
jgi:hypothetical protein